MGKRYKEKRYLLKNNNRNNKTCHLPIWSFAFLYVETQSLFYKQKGLFAYECLWPFIYHKKRKIFLLKSHYSITRIGGTGIQVPQYIFIYLFLNFICISPPSRFLNTSPHSSSLVMLSSFSFFYIPRMSVNTVIVVSIMSC